MVIIILLAILFLLILFGGFSILNTIIGGGVGILTGIFKMFDNPAEKVKQDEKLRISVRKNSDITSKHLKKNNKYETLEKLGGLLEKRIISKEEFEEEKKKILSDVSSDVEYIDESDNKEIDDTIETKKYKQTKKYRQNWECKKCSEVNENNFNICWNCNTSKDGTTLVTNQSGDETEYRPY